MENAFEIVLFVVVGVAVVGAVVSLAMSGDAWSGVGRGEMSIGEDLPVRSGSSSPSASSSSSFGGGAAVSPAAAAEREADIRSMLEARAARRGARGGPAGGGGVARGEPAGDVEAELAELLRPTPSSSSSDPELEAEVRQLVESRNARRVERG